MNSPTRDYERGKRTAVVADLAASQPVIIAEVQARHEMRKSIKRTAGDVTVVLELRIRPFQAQVADCSLLGMMVY